MPERPIAAEARNRRKACHCPVRRALVDHPSPPATTSVVHRARYGRACKGSPARKRARDLRRAAVAAAARLLVFLLRRGGALIGSPARAILGKIPRDDGRDG